MQQKRGKHRSPLSRRVESLLDLPQGMLGHCTRMEWTDNRQVQMDGVCEILEYDDTCVSVAVAGGRVQFWGDRLQLTYLTTESLLIQGTIRSMNYEEGLL